MSAPVTARVQVADHPSGSPLKRAGPCAIVILGAGGDLTARKLMPALYHLQRDGLLDEQLVVLGVARQRLDDKTFRDRMRESVETSGEVGEVEEKHWRDFAAKLAYIEGDLSHDQVYARIRERLETLEGERGLREWGRLFYLALPPSVYAPTLQHLADSGLAPRTMEPATRPWARVIIEKPFGYSLESARELNRTVNGVLHEHQVYRIDHYLGKETVQNLMVFRFANSIFEPVWNRQQVAHVQITAAESEGVGHRAGYYEGAGVVRDMFQNHLLQLLALTAMEPPVTFKAEAVRDEKVKVLRAIRPVDLSGRSVDAVLGQYGPGRADDEAAHGYREEDRVADDSRTATYAAVRFLIDNWRWRGVPFYLRSGKRLPRRVTEIAIQFRDPPHLMFPLPQGETIAPNVLAFRIQPDEGISLCFQVKTPGVDVAMTTVGMDFTYARAFDGEAHSAYETLLLDCMLGDATLFNRSDSVEAAWEVVDPVITWWDKHKGTDLPNYAAGSWGPAAADQLLARDGFRWRQP
ncbi:MAG: glucose-6-phosphate dehydrogenase [Gemmatimonadales bacterium]